MSYARNKDDLTVYITTSNPNTAKLKLQESIDKIFNWATNNGLTFSSEKTKCIIFSKKRQPQLIDLKLGSTKIKTTTSLKILGMIFDHRMTWKEHIEQLKSKCLTSLNVLKMTAHRNWGADRKTLELLYSTLVRSKMDYGSIIYDNAKNSDLQKLNPIQNSAIRLITGALYTSPIPSLHIDANVIPLHHRRTLLCLNYHSKLCFRQQTQAHKYTLYPNNTDLYIRKNRIPKPLGIRCKLYGEKLNYVIPTPHCSPINPKTQKMLIKTENKKLQKLITILWQNEWDTIYSNNKLH